MELDLGLAASFLVLAQERHYGIAARRLHLTRPALSKRVQRLERQLGTPLLARGPGGVVDLTADGRRFASMLGPLLSHAEAVRAAAGGPGSPLVVRVGVPAGARPALRGSALSRAISSTRGEHPGTTFVVVDVPFPDMSSSLPERRVDVLWTDSPVPHRDVTSVPSAFSSRRIGLVGAGHHLFGAATVDVGDFADEPMLWNPSAPEEWMRPFWLGDVRPRRAARLVAVDARDHDGVFRHAAAGAGVTTTLDLVAPYLGPGLHAVVLTDAPPVRFHLARRRADSRDAVLDLVRAMVPRVRPPSSPGEGLAHVPAVPDLGRGGQPGVRA